jgi:phosphohistidine phosphatase
LSPLLADDHTNSSKNGLRYKTVIMKTLMLVRHAKASQDPDFIDFERPLKNSGIEEATLMAERIRKEALIPQLLVSSPALRALTTANIYAEHLALHQPATNKAIYEGDFKTLLLLINEFPDEHTFIGMVGHNPDLANLLYYLTGEARDVVTCATIVIRFEFDQWRLISENTGTVTWYSTPNDHQ